MSCDAWRERLEAYVDGAGDEGSELEAHLRTCASCAADVVARLQMKRGVQAAGTRYTPSPEFRLNIEKMVSGSRESKEREPRWGIRWIPSLAAMAVAAVLLVVFTAIWVRHNEREQALAELLDLHVATLASSNPVDVISTDRHTVKPWFQGKLPFTFNLPELQDSQFKLLGGRVMYFEHSPGAQLLFEVRSHKVSVFVMQQQAGDLGVAMRRDGGSSEFREMAFYGETWTSGGLRYVVLGDVNASDISALGELLKAAARS
jgi:anti-sigma factor RsiW